MRPIPKCVTLLLLLLMANSQVSLCQTNQLYNYQHLSHLYYQKQRDSLEKNWACPSVYKEKETQKKYKEIWDGRTSFFTSAIKADNYLYEKEVYDYVAAVIGELTRANKEYLPVQPFLVLDRSPSVNAYAIGNNVIAVNLGLLSYVQTREDLAFTLAHELSHNIMQHAENAMKKRAEWLTSDEYKRSLDQVLDSKYERLTRLKKVYENYSFDRSRHQRYHESDADSLALVLLKNAHISFSPDFFLRLDSADMVYKQGLKQPVKNYFAPYGITIEDAWLKKRSRGLSTKNYNFQEAVAMQDSLKTHPDCIERYNRTKSAAGSGSPFTPIPAGIKEKADKMVIWNMYCNMSLATCTYRILLAKDKYADDPWFDFMLHNVILELAYADKDLHRFSAIGVTQKEYVSKDFYELQTMLEQIPREELDKSCKSMQEAAFWSKMTDAERGFKKLMLAITAANPGGGYDANIRSSKRVYSVDFSTSAYREYTEELPKK
ncbi:M48 family metalloprotease [Chitinophaga rhizophila]|uniref:M48 family metalloprotease n=1 Tax=Chitinophaga rhizophila TaxID=2866212 RepID=A0ABS7G6M7_9BACT|nr:M48 family metalloprotease [Chitinophaga rhizophila]MBW8682935.1 M48 family metalloprotease [Chitinophaga rhizophila]